MSIPFEARLVDLANLIVVKGANLVLTTVLFAIISLDMGSGAFADFGYWWSISIMVGGVLLGGLSSALIRTAAMHGSLHHLSKPLLRTAVGGLALAAAAAFVMVALPRQAAFIHLLLAAATFGVAVQAQAAVFALLRAVEATRTNVLASAIVVIVVPLCILALLGPSPSLTNVLWDLTIAFALGSAVALLAARKQLAHLFTPTSRDHRSTAFVANASSFTVVNIWAYAMVNVDFTIFRLIGTPGDFAMMATAKIFFERFILPALLVFGGAISIRILRHPEGAQSASAKLEARFTPLHLAVSIILVLTLCLAYEFFVRVVRGDTSSVPWQWVAIAAVGYLLYTVNGILFDVLVLRRSLPGVLTYVISFLIFGSALQALAISTLGVPGWALGWLAFNAVVAFVLARQGLRLRAVGWTSPA